LELAVKHDGALLKTISGRCHLLAFDGMQAATATYAARLVDSTFGSERESRRTSRCKVLIFSGCEPLPPTPVALSAALTQLRLDDIFLYSAADASVSAFVRAKVRPKLAQKLGQLQPFPEVFPQQGCMGRLAFFGPTQHLSR
jgi:hypothetical protein